MPKKYSSVLFLVIFIYLFSVSCGVNIFSTQNEVAMGNNLAKEVESQYTIVSDPAISGYVGGLGQKVVNVCDRQDISYSFNVIKNDSVVNAFAMPGGHIYVYTGLLYKIDNEAELVAALSHEVGHVVAKHSMKRLTQMYGAAFLTQLVLGQDAPQWQQMIAQMFTNMGILKYGRDNEFEADRYGVTYLTRSGYSPAAMQSLLQKFKEMNDHDPSEMEQLLSTHPPAGDRIDRAEIAEKTIAGNKTGILNTEQYHTFIKKLKSFK